MAVDVHQGEDEEEETEGSCVFSCPIQLNRWPCSPVRYAKGAGSFHIHRKTMKELGTLAVLGVREQPNLAQT